MSDDLIGATESGRIFRRGDINALAQSRQEAGQ